MTRSHVTIDNLAPALLRVPQAITTSFTLGVEDLGQFYTNKGAAALITFTLPALSAVPIGWWCEFYSANNDGIAVAAASTEQLTYNDDNATTTSFETNTTNIGSYIKVIKVDSANWAVVAHNGGLAEATSSITVA